MDETSVSDVDSLVAYYRDLGDVALAEAFAQGPAAYEAHAWSVVVREFETRRLTVLNLDARPSQPSAHSRAAAQAGAQGALYIIVGLAVTSFTYLLSSLMGRSHYLIAFGPVVVGLRYLLSGAELHEDAAAPRKIAIEQAEAEDQRTICR